MFLNRVHLIISLILCVHRVASSPGDIIRLKEHFIANLIEENRRIYSSQLTDDIERDISLKIEGFLNIISPPPARVQRDTSNLLLNEKSELDPKRFSLYFPPTWLVESKNFHLHVRRLVRV